MSLLGGVADGSAALCGVEEGELADGGALAQLIIRKAKKSTRTIFADFIVDLLQHTIYI